MKKTLKLDFYKISDELLEEFIAHLAKHGVKLSDVIERLILTIVEGKAQEQAIDWNYANNRELMQLTFKKFVLEDFPSALKTWENFKSDTFPYNKDFIKSTQNALAKWIPHTDEQRIIKSWFMRLDPENTKGKIESYNLFSLDPVPKE